jgi:hypothetical protein
MPYESYILINSNFKSFLLFLEVSRAFLSSILKNCARGCIIVTNGIKIAIKIPRNMASLLNSSLKSNKAMLLTISYV